MYYKSKFLMGFSLAFLFMSASLPVEAMEEEPEQKGTSKKKSKKENKEKGKLIKKITSMNRHRKNSKSEGNKKPYLTNSEDHVDKLFKTLEDTTRQIGLQGKSSKIFISSYFVSSDFMKSSFFPKIDELESMLAPVSKEFLEANIGQHLDTMKFKKILEEVKRKLKLVLCMTNVGLKEYEEAEKEYKETKKDQEQGKQSYVRVRLRPFDACASNLLMVFGPQYQDRLFIATSLPWLAPHIYSESSVHLAPILRGKGVTSLINNGRKVLKEAQRKDYASTRGYSVTGIEGVFEPDEPLASPSSIDRKQGTSGMGSLRRRIDENEAKEKEAKKERETGKTNDVNSSGGSDNDYSSEKESSREDSSEMSDQQTVATSEGSNDDVSVLGMLHKKLEEMEGTSGPVKPNSDEKGSSNKEDKAEGVDYSEGSDDEDFPEIKGESELDEQDDPRLNMGDNSGNKK